jgi:dephospho-CoA kinase
MTVYGVTGMPLAGKTTVAGLIKEKGFEMVDMGNVVRKEMNERDIPTEKTGEWVTEKREEKGKDAIAQFTVDHIDSKENLVITGMRSLEERKRFEKELDQKVEIIAVWASPEVRRKRMNERMREEDVKGQEFSDREQREIDQGVAELMALSNHMIVNEGLSMEELEEEVNQIVR